MSDELLKWLFGVNEVLKMSIATEHSDAPAQAFQQYVLKCMCWFRTTTVSHPFLWNYYQNTEKWVPTIAFFC